MGSVRVLRGLTLLASGVSLVAQGIALCSSCWLRSEELMPNPLFNGTGDRALEYLSKLTVSGLWQLCYNNPGKKDVHCIYIDYFPKEEYSPDPNDSTMAIPYAVKRAALFIFASTATLVAGMMLGLVGCLLKRRPVIIFIAGIIFILSGLFILAGIVIYISTFKAEVGNKLRPRSSFQGPMFKYQYGFSFLLAVTSLMLCELAGTFAVFLYIRWYQLEARRRREELRRCRKHPRGSLQDLSYLPFSRDTTCNTVSTDITRNHSREFSLETLRRTTPV